MRNSLILCLTLCLSSPSYGQDYRHVWFWASASTQAPPIDPTPTPQPVPSPDGKPRIGDTCPVCNGRGKSGDGIQPCAPCGGDGIVNANDPILTAETPSDGGDCKPHVVEPTPRPTSPRLTAADLSADTQPTPWQGVTELLNTLNPQEDEVLLDPGCGYDARILIAARQFFNVKHCIGVEKDPALAASARQYVKDAGLEDYIEIITGDSLELDIKADIAVCYMWEEFLKAYQPKLTKLDRFVCYGFKVPDLPMTEKTASNGGKVYLWTKAAIVAAPPVPATIQVPITRTVTSGQVYSLPRGSYCEVCGGRCSNPMAHYKQTQIVGYKTVPNPTVAQPPTTSQPAATPPQQPSWHYETRYRTQRVCDFNRWGQRTGCHDVQVPYQVKVPN